MSVITGIRRGNLLVALGGLLAGGVHADPPLQARSQVFEIRYKVDETALPLESVRLWYTTDQSKTWKLFGADEDRQSPITFHAPAEGEYGFYFVLQNSVGASNADPTPGSTPQLQVFVDHTPPVVQLHDLRQTTILGQRVVQIRWTAIDAFFPPRPVEISYQRPPEEAWHPVTTEPLSNTGRFDWRLPADAVGTLAIRVSVRDLGGHQVESEPKTIETTLPADVHATNPLETATSTNDPPAGGTGDVSKEARRLAAKAYEEGMKLAEQGEFRSAISHLREAVRFNPQLTDAFADMGGMLYRLGDLDRSLAAYGIALEQQPSMRRALQGRARVQRARNDYSAAAKSLRTILRYNPKDAEIWMNLGDIAIYQGDEILARECYLRATEIDPSATAVIEQANKRLDLMAEVSRTYRKEG